MGPNALQSAMEYLFLFSFFSKVQIFKTDFNFRQQQIVRCDTLSFIGFSAIFIVLFSLRSKYYVIRISSASIRCSEVLAQHVRTYIGKYILKHTIEKVRYRGSPPYAHFGTWKKPCYMKFVLKYGSEEKGSSFCKCSILLGFFYVKKTREVVF